MPLRQCWNCTGWRRHAEAEGYDLHALASRVTEGKHLMMGLDEFLKQRVRVQAWQRCRIERDRNLECLA